MKLGVVFGWFFLLGVIAFGSYMLFVELDRTPIELVPIDGSSEESLVPDYTSLPGQSEQFFPKLRFSDRTLRYEFDARCSPEKIESVLEAFSIFESRTVIRFSEGGNSDIFIACSDLAPPSDNEGHFIAGEGGPTKVLNTSLFTLILESKISLYREDECDDPHIAMHELLHVFGFDHNNNPRSILYPTLDCNQQYDDYFFERLDELYSVDSNPDLFIPEATITQEGRYLSFNISIENQGLALADGVELALIVDSKVIRTFDLGSVAVGTRKLLNVQNQRIPANAQVIVLAVDREDTIVELIETNNEKEFRVKS